MNLILNTPTKIYNALIPYFPYVGIEKEGNNPLSIRIKLNDSIPSIILTSSVVKEIFQLQIQALAIAQAAGRESEFNPDMCFSETPLQGWGKFQRIIYENEGNSCRELLAHYLKKEDQESLNALVRLELSPSDILNDATLDYFRELASEDESYIQLIKVRYPDVLPRLREIVAAQEFEHEKGLSAYEQIHKKLKSRVIGQSNALERVATSLASHQNQNTNNFKFLFVGPTGTGKTELAKAIGSLKDSIITFPMNQYPHESDTTIFFGSAPGYLGSSSKSVLAEKLDIACSPTLVETVESKTVFVVRDAVLLFDEIEKAHHKTRQSLLSLIDEGTFESIYTKEETNNNRNVTIVYNFESCVFVCTSNLFQSEILQAFNQNKNTDEINQMFLLLNQQNKLKGFAPEFLARFKITPFGPISRGRDYQTFLRLKLDTFLTSYQEQMGFREVVIEDDELQFYPLLEERVYGNGTNLRKVFDFCDTIEGSVLREYNNVSDFKNKKLTLFCENQRIMLKLSTFVLGGYVDTPVPSISIRFFQ